MNKKNTTENEPQIPKENEETKETKENPQVLEENEQNLQKPVIQWSKEKVGEWLIENGLGEKEVVNFSRQNGESIANFTQEQWVMMLGIVDGISFFNKVSKLKEGIFNQLKKRYFQPIKKRYFSTI